MRKPMLAAFLALCLVCAVAAAETLPTIVGENYVGVTERGFAGDVAPRALIDELMIAYVKADSAYMICGQPITWTIHAEGGDGQYEYVKWLLYREDRSAEYTILDSRANSDENTYTHTPSNTYGQYLLVAQVRDTAGNYVQYQTCWYDVYEETALEDETQVPGRIRQIAEECRTAVGDDAYAQALYLHDLLARTTTYDTSEAYIDGALLKGKGSCQSYTLSYEALLDELGIENLFISGVTGSSEAENHSWNLVKFGDNWYHIDVTWDDVEDAPEEGDEMLLHDYFALSDDQILPDHDFTASSMGLFPAATDDSLAFRNHGGMVPYSCDQDIIDALDAVAARRCCYIELFNNTGDAEFDYRSVLQRWVDDNDDVTDFSGYACGSVLYVHIGYADGEQYVEDAALDVHIDAGDLALTVGDVKRAVAYTLPYGYNDQLLWTSSDEAVAVVQDGYVTAVGEGCACIKVSCPCGQSDTIDVTVSGATPQNCVAIPAGTRVIDSAAFDGCAEIEYVIVPESTESIGAYAFRGCAGLVRIDIPASVLTIGDGAFDGCADVVIYTPSGSVAEAYAAAHGIQYILQ